MVIVDMAADAWISPPAEMAANLARLSVGVEADTYGLGGAVAAFEAQAAAFLGKEAAVMFPTGTLGNLMALRRLSGGAPARIIVHRDSHLFNDAGENLSQLGGLTMVPLAGAGGGFEAAQLQAEIDRAASARVAARIGAVAIESPSRRLHGRRFGAALPEVIALAQAAGLPLFLDGARMVIESAWTGQSPAEMAAPFDVVYLSLYKYLGAPFGCVVAGSSALLEGLFHDRRRFGGSLYQMWPAAVLAADALPRQATTWAEARASGAAVVDALAGLGRLAEVLPDGTNIVLLPHTGRATAVVEAARAQGIKLPAPEAGLFPLKINESWSRLSPAEIATRIDRSLQAVA